MDSIDFNKTDELGIVRYFPRTTNKNKKDKKIKNVYIKNVGKIPNYIPNCK